MVITPHLGARALMVWMRSMVDPHPIAYSRRMSHTKRLGSRLPRRPFVCDGIRNLYRGNAPTIRAHTCMISKKVRGVRVRRMDDHGVGFVCVSGTSRVPSSAVDEWEHAFVAHGCCDIHVGIIQPSISRQACLLAPMTKVQHQCYNEMGPSQGNPKLPRPCCIESQKHFASPRDGSRCPDW